MTQTMEESKEQIASAVAVFQKELENLMKKRKVKWIFIGVTNDPIDLDEEGNKSMVGGFAWSDVKWLKEPQRRDIVSVWDYVTKDFISGFRENPFEMMLDIVRAAARKAWVDVDAIEKEIDEEEKNWEVCENCDKVHP